MNLIALQHPELTTQVEPTDGNRNFEMARHHQQTLNKQIPLTVSHQTQGTAHLHILAQPVQFNQYVEELLAAQS